nr:helix-turn-helix domain-containing protein [Acidithiobacillus albertensis]
MSRIVSSRLSSVRLSLRARMILLAAEGLQNKEIAERLGVDRLPASRTLAQALSGTTPGGYRARFTARRSSSESGCGRLVELTTQSKPEMKKVRYRPWIGPNRDSPSKRAAHKR